MQTKELERPTFGGVPTSPEDWSFFMQQKNIRMEKQQFTIDDEEYDVLANYVKNWQEWPVHASETPEERLCDLEDFALSHEELLHDLYSRIDTLKEEIRQLKNGRE